MTEHPVPKKKVGFSGWLIMMVTFDILGVVLLLNDAILPAVAAFFIASIFVLVHVKSIAATRTTTPDHS